jgi:hypothetical protein
MSRNIFASYYILFMIARKNIYLFINKIKQFWKKNKTYVKFIITYFVIVMNQYPDRLNLWKYSEISNVPI